MPRLIVDDAGKQKAFRVTKGRLSVGSNAESKLSLNASGVEDHHANLLVTPEGVRVQVLAPVTIAGERVLGGEVELEFGQSLLIGAATIVVKSDAESAAPSKAAVRTGASGGRAGSSARRSSGGSSSRRDAKASGGRRRAGDRGREQKQGVPPIAIVGGIAVLLVVVVFFFKGMANPGEQLNRMVAAEEMLGEGKLERARTLLSSVDTSILEDADVQRHRDLMAQLDEREVFMTELSDIQEASTRISEDLKGLVSKQFKTEPVAKPKVRLLLDYIDRFRADFPKHASELWLGESAYGADYDWLLEAEQKYGDQASTSEPYTVEDVAFREEYFLTKSPKRFNEVMPVLEAAIAAAGDSDREALVATRERLTRDQRVYADERMAKAKQEYQNSQIGTAASILITDILYLTDPQLADRAAEVLVGFSEAEALFRGVKDNQPERFAALQRNDRIKRFVDANLAVEEPVAEE